MSDAKVHKLKAPADPLVPAIDLSIIQNLPGDRQIQVKTCFLQSTGQKEVDHIMDSLFRAGDRQKAKYDLASLHDDLVKHEKTLAVSLEDLARLDVEHEAAKVARENEVRNLSIEREKLYQTSLQAHSSTRSGAYKPQGATKSRLDSFSKQAESFSQAQAKADAAYFAVNCGRALQGEEAEDVGRHFLKAYRWQYIFSGAGHPRFQGIVKGLIGEAQMKRIEAALGALP